MSPVSVQDAIDDLALPAFAELQFLVGVADVVEGALGWVGAEAFVIRRFGVGFIAFEERREGFDVSVVEPLEDEVEEGLARELSQRLDERRGRGGDA
jgi:hypothetical protein